MCFMKGGIKVVEDNLDKKGFKDLLDDHVRKIIKYHFNPITGTPYWIRYAKKLGIDPIREIECYEDLRLLGDLNSDDLKVINVEDFIPKSRLDFKKYNPHVYETGGTSGDPKRIIDTTHQKENAVWICKILKYHGFKEKGNWLNLFPSGPHAVSLLTYTIARERGELSYSIDIDPRWVKLLIRENQKDTMELYIDHIINQAIRILETQNIKYIFTTPKLLEELILKFDIKNNIKGIICGGTPISTEFYKFIKNEALPNVDFCAIYGNTLMGVAPQIPNEMLKNNDSPWSINYYSYFPNFIIDVVDKDNPSIKVKYGQQGRVKITVLNKDVFIPGLLERDVCTRIESSQLFKWDGISNISGFRHMQADIVEGVY